jgi:serine/threonine protein phosphatase PrpC
MGAYLSQPVTEKESGEGERFGYSSMQGWRTDHEDAHICVPELGLFGVFDGHGGAEVARFAAAHVPRLVREKFTDASPAGAAAALRGAFEGVDDLLRL